MTNSVDAVHSDQLPDRAPDHHRPSHRPTDAGAANFQVRRRRPPMIHSRERSAVKRVVQMSGGIGSFAAATRVAQRYGTKDMVLLFADTLAEDEDLYRFLSDAEEYLRVPLVRVCDGRTPWQVFADVRFIGNSRVAPCSKWLKQIPCRRWLEQHCDPADTVLYVGLDWAERRREPGVVHGWAPWRVEFPMAEDPYLTKEQMLDDCRARGLVPPRLYELGYSHNNCGGVCVRAGHKQWRHTLRVFPERFAEAERQENHLRTLVGDRSILTEQIRSVKYPLPLSELRRRAECAPTPHTLSETAPAAPSGRQPVEEPSFPGLAPAARSRRSSRRPALHTPDAASGCR
ncbi:hypothetical protein AB0346_00420 [Nocardia beijingensis]|uniref:hypothetical protein n=1 Tax=Nocardia beijingensis TaxID=95162 RepID=UPI00344E4854